MSSLIHTRAVLFDLDGTLVDSLPGIEFSVDCALANCGFPPRTRELRPLIGPPIRIIFSRLQPASDQQTLSRLESAFRQSYDSIGWSKTVLADAARETLLAFRDAELSLFVVTNKPSAASRKILEALGLLELFADVICRDSRAPAFSSKADMLRHALEMHHLQAERCLYVGDTSEDYAAAREVAMPVAIVSYGYGTPGLSHPECIDIENLAELLTILGVMEMP